MDSVFINMAALFLHPLFMVLTSSTAPTTSFATSLSLLFSSALPMAMILTLAAVGIVTSLMLRHINSVAKAVASSTEVAITTILGSVFFGYQITPLVLVSVALVAGGAYIYATDKDGGDGGGVAVAVFVPVLAPPRRKRYSMRIGRIGTALLTGATAYSGCASYLALKAATSQHSNSAQDHKEHLGFALVVLQKPANQGRRFKTAKGWFEDDGTNFLAHSATELNLRHKNSAWLDENLHRLSRWSFSSSEWERFEQMHLWSNPMLKVILAAEGCRVLEIGSGAGAFSRSLSLRLYDNVHVSGVDYSDKLVAVSRMAVSKKTPRFNAHVLASMEDATSMRAAIANASNMNGVAEQKPSFHVVTMIGSLCYMPHPNSVVMALTNALENLKIGGLLVASTMLLPQTMMAMGSYCETLVTRDMLIEMSSILRYDILSIVDMEPWGIGDQKGQYLAILRKTGSANNNYQPANQSPTGPALYTGNSTGLGTDWPESTKPPNVRRKKFKRFRTGQKVLEYIIRKLQEKGVPVAITYGTAFHEFRAGNGISFKPRITDKDIDIAVFEQHLALVPDMDVDIRRLFGWKVVSVSIERLYVKIVPLDDFRKRGQPTDISFQLDVYGFRCNAMDNLVKFPWDKTSARLNAFLPLRQHVSLQAPLSNGTQSHVYMPSDPACFLENMYGADFRTPADTKFFRRMAIDSPICAERVLGASERLELMRQLVFCGGCSASSANMEVVANVTSGLPAKAPLCS
jgi:SAM-dependent methyltransferase